MLGYDIMGIETTRTAIRSAVAAIVLLTHTACGGPAIDPAGSAAGTTEGTGGAVFTATDMSALRRGLQKEIEAVRAAQSRSSTATTPQERGLAIQASFETATIPLGAEAAGLSADRYGAPRDTVFDVLRTLDFQDKIDGPLSLDLSRADAATKERLSRDAFVDLPEASASVLRAHLDEILPVWLEYTNLTAVAG